MMADPKIENGPLQKISFVQRIQEIKNPVKKCAYIGALILALPTFKGGEAAKNFGAWYYDKDEGGLNGIIKKTAFVRFAKLFGHAAGFSSTVLALVYTICWMQKNCAPKNRITF